MLIFIYIHKVQSHLFASGALVAALSGADSSKLSAMFCRATQRADSRPASRSISAALRKSLDRFYPNIRDVHLIDYKVRVVNARAGTAARVRVIIESRDADSLWGTVGVSENIIEASWEALVDGVEYKLFLDEEEA